MGGDVGEFEASTGAAEPVDDRVGVSCGVVLTIDSNTVGDDDADGDTVVVTLGVGVAYAPIGISTRIGTALVTFPRV